MTDFCMTEHPRHMMVFCREPAEGLIITTTGLVVPRKNKGVKHD